MPADSSTIRIGNFFDTKPHQFVMIERDEILTTAEKIDFDGKRRDNREQFRFADDRNFFATNDSVEYGQNVEIFQTVAQKISRRVDKRDVAEKISALDKI